MTPAALPRTDEGWTSTPMGALVGRTIRDVWWSDHVITFETDEGCAAYSVEGDCCSHSYFHDLIGLDKLLAGPVVTVETVDLDSTDATCALCRRDYGGNGDVVAAYGYRLVTLHPTWGEVSCVISFRNDSNGYYGGYLTRASQDRVVDGQELLTDDKVTG